MSASAATPRRSGLVSWAPLVVGCALALAGLQVVQQNFLFDTDLAGLGIRTRALFGSVDGARVHCAAPADTACLSAYRAAGSPPAVVWLGNSQLHGVNRYRPGEKTAP